MPREAGVSAPKDNKFLYDFLEWMDLNHDEQVIANFDDDGVCIGFVDWVVQHKFEAFQEGWLCRASYIT